MYTPRQLRPARPARQGKKQAWVIQWAKSESFWRDVASRALAGLIVVAAGAIGAAVLGLIDLGQLIQFCIALAVVILAAVIVGLLPPTVGSQANALVARFGWERKSKLRLFVLVLINAFGAFFVLFLIYVTALTVVSVFLTPINIP